MVVDNPCTTEAKSKNHKPLQMSVDRKNEPTAFPGDSFIWLMSSFVRMLNHHEKSIFHDANPLQTLVSRRRKSVVLLVKV